MSKELLRTTIRVSICSGTVLQIRSVRSPPVVAVPDDPAGMLVAAVLHNGDILIWCTYSGECEVLSGPPLISNAIIKELDSRASIFSVHQKMEPGYLSIAISDDAKTVLLMTREGGLWICFTNMFMHRDSMFTEPFRKPAWHTIQHKFAPSMAISTTFHYRHPIHGSAWSITQLHFQQGDSEQVCDYSKADRVHIHIMFIPVSKTGLSTSCSDGHIPFDCSIVSSYSKQILYSWDSDITTLAFIANTSSPRDTFLDLILRCDFQHRRRLHLGRGILPNQSSWHIVAVNWTFNDQLICVLSSALDLAIIERASGEVVQLVCAGKGAINNQVEPNCYLPVTIHCNVVRRYPNKLSLSTHPTSPQILISNGYSYVELVFGDIQRSSVVFAQHAPTALRMLFKQLESSFWAKPAESAQDLILKMLEQLQLALSSLYYLDAIQALIAIEQRLYIHKPKNATSESVYGTLGFFWAALASGLAKSSPMLSHYVRECAVTYCRHAEITILELNPGVESILELYLQHRYSEFLSALHQDSSIPRHLVASCKFALCIIRYDVAGALKLFQSRPVDLNADLSNILFEYFRGPMRPQIRVVSPVAIISRCYIPSQDGAYISRVALSIAVNKLEPQLAALFTRPVCIANLLRCYRVADALVMCEQPALSAAIVYCFNHDRLLLDKYIEYLIEYQHVSAMLDVIQIDGTIAERASTAWLEAVQSWIKEESLPNMNSNASLKPVVELLSRVDLLIQAADLTSRDLLDTWQQLLWIVWLLGELQTHHKSPVMLFKSILKLRLVSKYTTCLSEYNIQNILLQCMESVECASELPTLCSMYPIAQEEMFPAFKQRNCSIMSNLQTASIEPMPCTNAWYYDDDRATLDRVISSMRDGQIHSFHREFDFSQHVEWIRSLQLQWEKDMSFSSRYSSLHIDTTVPLKSIPLLNSTPTDAGDNEPNKKESDKNQTNHRETNQIKQQSKEIDMVHIAPESITNVDAVELDFTEIIGDDSQRAPTLTTTSDRVEFTPSDSLPTSTAESYQEVVSLSSTSRLSTPRHETPDRDNIHATTVVPLEPEPKVTAASTKAQSDSLSLEELNECLSRDDILKMLSSRLSVRDILKILQGRSERKQAMSAFTEAEPVHQVKPAVPGPAARPSPVQPPEVAEERHPSLWSNSSQNCAHIWTQLQSDSAQHKKSDASASGSPTRATLFGLKETSTRPRNPKVFPALVSVKMARPQASFSLMRPLISRQISAAKPIRLFQPLFVSKQPYLAKTGRRRHPREHAGRSVQTAMVVGDSETDVKDDESVMLQHHRAPVPAVGISNIDPSSLVNSIDNDSNGDDYIQSSEQQGEPDPVDAQPNKRFVQESLSFVRPGMMQLIRSDPKCYDKSDTVTTNHSMQPTFEDIASYAREVIIGCVESATSLVVGDDAAPSKTVPFSITMSEYILGLHEEDREQQPAPVGQVLDVAYIDHMQLTRPLVRHTRRRPVLAAFDPTKGVLMPPIVDNGLLDRCMDDHIKQVRRRFQSFHSERIVGFRSGMLSILNPGSMLTEIHPLDTDQPASASAMLPDKDATTLCIETAACLPQEILLPSLARETTSFLSVCDMEDDPLGVDEVENQETNSNEQWPQYAISVTDLESCECVEESLGSEPVDDESRPQYEQVSSGLDDFDAKLAHLQSISEGLFKELNICNLDLETVAKKADSESVSNFEQQLDQLPVPDLSESVRLLDRIEQNVHTFNTDRIEISESPPITKRHSVFTRGAVLKRTGHRRLKSQRKVRFVEDDSFCRSTEYESNKTPPGPANTIADRLGKATKRELFRSRLESAVGIMDDLLGSNSSMNMK